VKGNQTPGSEQLRDSYKRSSYHLLVEARSARERGIQDPCDLKRGGRHKREDLPWLLGCMDVLIRGAYVRSRAESCEYGEKRQEHNSVGSQAFGNRFGRGTFSTVKNSGIGSEIRKLKLLNKAAFQ